ncbi:hypothetical protein ASD53_07305 [Lysobacter sp. Root559]|uniref:DUF885 domain-containing protein n=1 Tax=Lysobacter sp. Root559 TaxID=1736559 RepID=UPI0006FADA10|nr:DUF885 family protein [Lysobacter sp. Root559]KQZ59360.1 hypothetical protein ASD53_07305 [Lysobacter sp. Root559]
MIVRLLCPSLLLAVLSLAGVAPASTAESAGAAAANQATRRLRDLYEAEWLWRQQEFVQVREPDGRWVDGDRMPSVTPQAWQRRVTYWEKALAQLDTVPEAQLSDEERINAAVFRTSVAALLNNARYRTYEAPFNSDTFFWGDLNPRRPYQKAEEYRRLLGRLHDLPRYFDENIANMRAGLARGYSVPRVAIEGRDRTIEPYAKDGPDNPFSATFAAIPAHLGQDARRALQAEGERAIRDEVAPAYAKLLRFMREEYLPRTRTSTAASELPDGRAFYRSQILEYTTTALTPAQIHEIGKQEVARISAEMHEVMRKTGFKGSFAEFLVFLRSDPQFYAKTPRELLSYSAYVTKKVDGRLEDLFTQLPRKRFAILPVPNDIAPVYTSGRGGLDSCLMNTYDLPSRPLYTLAALTLHECVPGHSHQAAMALEAPDRPDFRRQTYFSGYGEGWGLYTEWLGIELGVYETPYEDFGRLSFEMWRAARLVIDTGLHEYGWTRQQAIDYLSQHTALAPHDIRTEVDRYISWPGQALAYYLGYRSIHQLRSEAETQLGGRFDEAKFHDALLNLGSVPLAVMEREMRRFAAARQAAPDAVPTAATR